MASTKTKKIKTVHPKTKPHKLSFAWFKALSYYDKTTFGLVVLSIVLPYVGWVVGSILNPNSFLSASTWLIVFYDASWMLDPITWIVLILWPALCGPVIYIASNPIYLLLLVIVFFALIASNDLKTSRSVRFRVVSYILCGVGISFAICNLVLILTTGELKLDFVF